MSRIEDLLKQYGPMLSGELAARYEANYSATNEAARKAISREKNPVRKLRVFPFANNQIFCYLEKDQGSYIYKERLYDALKSNSASMASILAAIENFDGVIAKDLLPLYTSSPIERTKGHRTFKRNIEILIKYGILCEANDDYYALNQGYGDKEINIGYSMAHERICKILANDFMRWAANLNLTAYNSVCIYPEVINFLHFNWFATSPSYVQPVFDINENKPGFLLVDVLYKPNAGRIDVRFFVDKVNIVRKFKKVKNICPVLLVESLTPEALQYLKENKIMIGIISNLFDKRYSQLLADIYNVFKNATAVILNEPGKIDDLLQAIEKSEGRFNNMGGALFECMVGLFYQRQGVSYLELNKQIRNEKGGYYEMDVLACQGNKVIITECKAMKSKLDLDYVQKWLSSRVPEFRKWVKQIYGERTIEFQLWSISGFTDDALKILIPHKENAQKYQLNFLDRQGLIALAKEHRDSAFAEQLKNYFGQSLELS